MAYLLKSSANVINPGAIDRLALIDVSSASRTTSLGSVKIIRPLDLRTRTTSLTKADQSRIFTEVSVEHQL